METKIKEKNNEGDVVVPFKPPNWAELVERFGADWENVVVTYFPHIHAKRSLSSDLLEHELVHWRQQRDMGVEIWWSQYFSDPEFRLEQELEAYQNQYRHIQKYERNKRKQYQQLDRLASDLTEGYDLPVTKMEAMRQIKNA